MNELFKKIPALEAKIGIDLINGITNQKDFINSRKSQGKFYYYWSLLTGQDYKKSTLIFENINQQMEGIASYLNILEKDQNKLYVGFDKIVQGVSILDKKIDALSENITDKMMLLQKKLQEKFKSIEKQIQKVDLKVEVSDQIDLECAKLSMDYQDYPYLVKTIIVLLNLKYGAFGCFLNKYPDDPKIEEYKIRLFSRLKKEFEEEFGHSYAYTSELMDGIKKLYKKDEKDVVMYLISEYTEYPIQKSILKLLEKGANFNDRFIEENNIKNMEYLFDFNYITSNICNEILSS